MRCDNVGRGLWAVLALGAMATASQASQPAEQEAQGLVEKARPHLEAVFGGPIGPLPRFRVYRPEALPGGEQEELEAEVRWELPDLQGEARLRAVLAAAELCRSVCLARYQLGQGEILLFPGNRERIEHSDPELRPPVEAGFYELALVHEMARCVLDRRYDLPKRQRACRDAEAFRTLQAVIEGRAQWVTREVARQMGLAEVFSSLARVFLRAADVTTDPALRMASQQVLRERYWAYAAGLAFFNDLAASGMTEVEATVFRRSPTQSAWIEHPEHFRRLVVAGGERLDEVLAHLEGALPAADWSASQDVWTADMVRQAADLFGEGKRALQSVRGWDEGRTVVWTARGKPMRQVAVSVARFADRRQAQAFFAFIDDLEREATSHPVPGVQVIEAGVKPLLLPELEEAEWRNSKRALGPASEPLVGSRLIGRSGPWVVEIAWDGMPGDREWARRVCGQLQQHLK